METISRERCDVGYVLPFCSPDPSMKVQRKNPSNEIDANLTRWAYTWGYEKCSNKDERMTFSLVKSSRSSSSFT